MNCYLESTVNKRGEWELWVFLDKVSDENDHKVGMYIIGRNQILWWLGFKWLNIYFMWSGVVDWLINGCMYVVTCAHDVLSKNDTSREIDKQKLTLWKFGKTILVDLWFLIYDIPYLGHLFLCIGIETYPFSATPSFIASFFHFL